MVGLVRLLLTESEMIAEIRNCSAWKHCQKHWVIKQSFLRWPNLQRRRSTLNVSNNHAKVSATTKKEVGVWDLSKRGLQNCLFFPTPHLFEDKRRRLGVCASSPTFWHFDWRKKNMLQVHFQSLYLSFYAHQSLFCEWMGNISWWLKSTIKKACL
jgi:hypothetical protein